jgi:hypothetical protein
MARSGLAVTIYRSASPLSPARATLLRVAYRAQPVSLAEVLADAGLQTRMDRTYLVPLAAVPVLVARLPGYRVLEIDGRRDFGYESVYFDTAELLTYREHVRGQRGRFKVRTRTYLESGDCLVETKVRGGRGETVKRRLPYEPAMRTRLTEPARRFVAEQIRQPGVVDALRPTVVTTYRRVTFAELTSGARVTCDVDLASWACGSLRTMLGPDDHVLVETKSAGSTGLADRVLRSLGIRPVGMSKYCVAVAMLVGGLPANPWHRTMRRHFDRQPGRRS